MPNISKKITNTFSFIDYTKVLSANFSENLTEVENFDDFIDLCKTTISICRKTVTLGNNKKCIKPYINRDILALIHRKRKLFLESKLYPENQFLKMRYITFRNSLANIIKNTKKRYYDNKLESGRNNQNKFWSTLNELVFNKSRSNKDTVSSILNDENETISEPKLIAEYFNTYFINIGSTITNGLPLSSKSFEDYIDFYLEPKFEFKAETSCKMDNILKNLNSNAAVGIDTISVKFLKTAKTVILPVITKLVNKIYQLCDFPDSLKSSKIIFLHKSGSSKNVANFRPISILSSCSKLLESSMHDQLQSYMIENNLIKKNQFGFLPKSSVLSATIHLTDFIYKNLYQQKNVGCIFLDLKKAFDCVPHNILIYKLSCYGLKESAIELLASYLSNRKQTSSINSILSEPEYVKTGVPQGGIMSSLLFIIFINDIFDLPLFGSIQMYADDSVIKYSCNTITELQSNMQHDLNIIYDWLLANKVQLNIEKSNYIVFSLSGNYHPISLSIDGKNLHQQIRVKYLGLTLNYSLKWSDHITLVKSKIAPIIFALARARRYISEKTAWNIYYTYVYPHISFMLPLWGKGTNNELNTISILQNKCVKIIRKLDYLFPTSLIYDAKVLNLSLLTKFETICLIFKIKYKLLKCNIVLPNISHIHSYPTRRRNDFYISTCRTSKAQNNVFYYGLLLYNELPPNLKNIDSVEIFKKTLKKYLTE